MKSKRKVFLASGVLSAVVFFQPLNSKAVPASRQKTTIVQSAKIHQQCSVRTIFVAQFGNDPRHMNFRLFLEKWLSKKKFQVVKRPQDADAVLTGTLSINSGNKSSNLALKDAELKTASGEKPWHRDFDFTTKNAFGWLGRGHIENGAKRIAEDIRASCK